MQYRKKLMKLAFYQAKIAFLKGEIPVGAVIAQGSKILSFTHNQVITKNDPTAHAEILAIRQACNKIGNCRISSSCMYVTLEPCSMCMQAIKQSRISCILFATHSKSPHASYKTKVIHNDTFEKKSCSLINNFFSIIRNIKKYS